MKTFYALAIAAVSTASAEFLPDVTKAADSSSLYVVGKCLEVCKQWRNEANTI